MVRLKKGNILKAIILVCSFLLCFQLMREFNTSQQANVKIRIENDEREAKLDMVLKDYNDQMIEKYGTKYQITYEIKPRRVTRKDRKENEEDEALNEKEMNFDDIERMLPFERHHPVFGGHDRRPMIKPGELDEENNIQDKQKDPDSPVIQRPRPQPNTEKEKEKEAARENEKTNSNYIQQISARRINGLFDKLYEHEQKHGDRMKNLGLLMFKNVIETGSDPTLKDFDHEKDTFLQVSDKRVKVTNKFIDYLYNMSDFYTFNHPRNSIVKKRIENKTDKPVLVTAANSKYYLPLQATIMEIHKYLSDYELIVYDLGLDEDMHKMTVTNCKCKVIKFNMSYYAEFSAHILDLHTYSWKPLLIQETLRSYDSVLYLDSSIRFKSGELAPIFATLKETGLLTQFIGLKLTCYTNPQMFAWFNEEVKSYESFFTIEANILLFHRNFLTTLMMKSWVTCALDENCIAPPGSRIGGCCGCHRYDQDAITLTASFFFAHPVDTVNRLPAYSLTTYESYFFDVKRYEGRDYFTRN